MDGGRNLDNNYTTTIAVLRESARSVLTAALESNSVVPADSHPRAAFTVAEEDVALLGNY